MNCLYYDSKFCIFAESEYFLTEEGMLMLSSTSKVFLLLNCGEDFELKDYPLDLSGIAGVV